DKLSKNIHFVDFWTSLLKNNPPLTTFICLERERILFDNIFVVSQQTLRLSMTDLRIEIVEAANNVTKYIHIGPFIRSMSFSNYQKNMIDVVVICTMMITSRANTQLTMSACASGMCRNMKSGFKSADRQPILDETHQRYVEFNHYRQQNAADHSLAPPLLHIDNNRAKTAPWRRIIDLDEFFTRIYEYHKRGGFWCMVLEDIFELLRFSFVAIFLGFLFTCVDYQILFRDKKLVRPGNQTDKVTLSDAINFDSSKMTFSVVLCIIVACIFWMYWLAVLLWKLSRHLDIRNFYYEILKIDDSSLPNLKWSEILTKLRQAQRTYQFCVHKTALNEMEVYHQILRRKNYIVALVNKTLLPARFTLPLLGEVSYFTNGLKLNFEFLFFL
uniref:Autophagy-related protein 9 n=1 Tax=Romanomermis culicivorax TaxID=13658 RepID=A0A915LD89_ROMCU